MTVKAEWQPGLSGETSIGANGVYREHAGFEVTTLATCTWKNGCFHELGHEAHGLFEPQLPADFRRRQTDCSWTGRTLEYTWDDGDLSIDIRNTLPGPCVRTTTNCIRLRTVPHAEWRVFTELRTGQQIDMHGACNVSGAQLFHVTSDRCDYIIAASQPIISLEVVSHRHYYFTAASDALNLLIVPIYNDADIPRDAEQQELWLSLAQNPMKEVQEQFRATTMANGTAGIEIEAVCSTAGNQVGEWAPLPLAATVLNTFGAHNGLVELPASRTLVHTWFGPFCVTAGSTYRYSIATAWQNAQVGGGEEIADENLSAIPEELTYAGDATWEPGTCMDQLFSLRAWAPYVHAAPQRIQDALLPQLQVPFHSGIP